MSIKSIIMFINTQNVPNGHVNRIRKYDQVMIIRTFYYFINGQVTTSTSQRLPKRLLYNIKLIFIILFD